MGIRFVIGRAGAGKTRWCLQQIERAMRQDPLGTPIYWILPRQATFAAQRQLACGELGGYFRARVVSFEDLGREVLAECGGSAVPEVTDLGRRMILGNLLRKLKDQLRFFQEVAHQPGVAAELDSTFDELERCGVVAGELKGGRFADPALDAKVHDLALVYGAYSEFLGQDRLDPNRRLIESLASIRKCPSLQRADVYVDSFYDFTLYQRQVLTTLGQTCRSLSITLMLDPNSLCIGEAHHIPDELSLFHKTELAYRRLWFGFSEQNLKVEAPILLQTAQRFTSRDLKAIEGWDDRAASQKSDGGVRLIEAYDRRAEVDAAAREVLEWVAGGMRYRDIAVLMRSEEEYRDLIDASFQEHGIPIFIDRRRTAAHHPLLRLIRAALATARTNWGHEPVMAFLKTGLAGLLPDEVDVLENYVLQHGIHHGTWTLPRPWTARRRRGEDADENDVESIDAKLADALRQRVVDRLQPFVKIFDAKELSLAAMASGVFTLLEGLGVRDKIVLWMQQAEKLGRLEERGEHERVWDELVLLFDEMVELLGNERISLDDFAGILDSALEGFDLALTPPTVDQVLVGAVDRTRTGNVKGCIMLGLSEGQFPRVSYEGSIFSDADRRMLGQQKIDLDPDTQRRLLDENFLGYVGFTRASEKLTLTRSTSNGANQAIGTSPFWDRVRKAVADVGIGSVGRSDELPLNLIATPRQLITGLMGWVRAGADSGGDKMAWRAIYDWLAAHAPCGDSIDTVRFAAWKALTYRNDASLEPGLAKNLFTSPLSVGIGEIESFRACPYQHFARYGLGLVPRQKPDVDGAELSRVYHEVLHRLASELIRTERGWADLKEPDARRILADLTQEAAKQLNSELTLSTARNRYLLQRIAQTLAWVTAAQHAAAQRGSFRPALTNVRFGEQKNAAGPPPLPPLVIRTPGGKQVMIHGKIDRIDLASDGSACAIDYRLRGSPLDATRAYQGLSLQLLLSLLLLQKNGEHLKKGKLTPVAAFSVQLLRELKNDNPMDALQPDDPLFHLAVNPRGIFDASIARQLDKELVEGRSPVVNIHIKKDGEIGFPERSDAASAQQLAHLLRHVERRIGSIADEIISGEIRIRPYRLGTTSACGRCEFRDVCRFEAKTGEYDDLPKMNRVEMLNLAADEK